jgi:hypothetical protein
MNRAFEIFVELFMTITPLALAIAFAVSVD